MLSRAHLSLITVILTSEITISFWILEHFHLNVESYVSMSIAWYGRCHNMFNRKNGLISFHISCRLCTVFAELLIWMQGCQGLRSDQDKCKSMMRASVTVATLVLVPSYLQCIQMIQWSVIRCLHWTFFSSFLRINKSMSLQFVNRLSLVSFYCAFCVSFFCFDVTFWRVLLCSILLFFSVDPAVWVIVFQALWRAHLPCHWPWFREECHVQAKLAC